MQTMVPKKIKREMEGEIVREKGNKKKLELEIGELGIGGRKMNISEGMGIRTLMTETQPSTIFQL